MQRMDDKGLALYEAARKASEHKESLSIADGATHLEYRDARRAETAAWAAYNAHLVERLKAKK